MTTTSTAPPPTRVLAIASHVTYGYVGNKMVSFVLQALGCDVSAINTVHFSNHTAYKYFKGTKTSAEEIQCLYDGLRHNLLNNFDMMLSGYTGSKEAVETVGRIGKELSRRQGFFWILDPVMGDEGRLYVDAAIPSAYKSIIRHSDLILPNSFEAEVLTGVQIVDLPSVANAITILHQTFKVPHVVITSLRFGNDKNSLLVAGSSRRSDGEPRIFSIRVPSLPVFFSGTGDMFAALMLVRLREASSPFHRAKSWEPPDVVSPAELPLAKATEKTLASMHAVLVRTANERAKETADLDGNAALQGSGGPEKAYNEGWEERVRHVLTTRASEIRVVQSVEDMKSPNLSPGGDVKFQAQEVQIPKADLAAN